MANSWGSILLRAARLLAVTLFSGDKTQKGGDLGRLPRDNSKSVTGESAGSQKPIVAKAADQVSISARKAERPSGANSASSRNIGQTSIREFDPRIEGMVPFSYAPHADGHADPGEVVWTWVPFEEDPTLGKDRPVLVLARHNKKLIVAQLTSKDHDHDSAKQAHYGRFWTDIGTGDWDRLRRPSELRIDRLLLVDPTQVRREGGALERAVFERAAARIRDFHQER